MYVSGSLPQPRSIAAPTSDPAAAASELSSMYVAIRLVRSSSRIVSSARKKKPSSNAPNIAPVSAWMPTRYQADPLIIQSAPNGTTPTAPITKSRRAPCRCAKRLHSGAVRLLAAKLAAIIASTHASPKPSWRLMYGV
jgi:hypothetical protein